MHTISPSLRLQQTHQRDLDPVGLVNIGNSCYLNALLQQLIGLRSLFPAQKEALPESTVWKIMLSIRTVYSDPQRTKEDLETHLLALRANLPKPFNGTEQQDADELFDKLVDEADSTSTITVSFMNPSFLSMKFRRSKLTLLPLLEFPLPPSCGDYRL